MILSFHDIKHIRDLMMGYKDFSIQDAFIGNQILILDPDETVFHVEVVNNNLHKVWDIKAWNEFKRLNDSRTVIEQQIELKNKPNEKRAKGIFTIVKGMSKFNMEEKMAVSFAARLYDTKNEAAIKKFTDELVEW